MSKPFTRPKCANNGKRSTPAFLCMWPRPSRSLIPTSVYRAEEQYMSKILVVDDSPTARAFIVDTLAGTGHHILTAVDGEEALHKASTERPDLILLDVVMPDRVPGWLNVSFHWHILATASKRLPRYEVQVEGKRWTIS